MSERWKSLRLWLIVAMLATAVVTMLVGNALIHRVNAKAEVAADHAKALRTARAIAAGLDDAAVNPADLRLLQQALPHDQLIVVRHRVQIFTGPSRAGSPLEVTAAAPFSGGKVILRDHEAPNTRGVAQVTLMAGVLAALIIGEAWLGATLLMRTVRNPLRRAIDTATRIAEGDFSARMGVSGPEEFNHLSRALDRMAVQLQRADSEQRRFLADLTHEIATPVSAVSGFITALVDGNAQTPAERAEAVDIVVQESHRLERLLEDVRTLNRLERSDSSRREQVDLSLICVEAVRRFRWTAHHAGVSLQVDAKPVSVIADPRLIEAVVNNLLTNAIRYTPTGGMVQVRARKRGSSVVVAVRDTGVGIAPEHLERIFDRLYRVDEARNRATGGSGLGLAIARNAAQSLGGRIEVDSTPDTGSEFRLVLDTTGPVPRPPPRNVQSQPHDAPTDASL